MCLHYAVESLALLHIPHSSLYDLQPLLVDLSTGRAPRVPRSSPHLRAIRAPPASPILRARALLSRSAAGTAVSASNPRTSRPGGRRGSSSSTRSRTGSAPGRPRTSRRARSRATRTRPWSDRAWRRRGAPTPRTPRRRLAPPPRSALARGSGPPLLHFHARAFLTRQCLHTTIAFYCLITPLAEVAA